MADAFDLNRFAPPETATFKLRSGHQFTVYADPDVDDVARMLRIEDVVQGRVEGDVGGALVEGKELLARLIGDYDPGQDVSGFRLGAQELMTVFTLILHGETVAGAVLEAITAAGAPAGTGPDSGEPAGEPGGDEAADGEGGTVAPLPSVRRSSEPSSGSAAREAGLPATGTA